MHYKESIKEMMLCLLKAYGKHRRMIQHGIGLLSRSVNLLQDVLKEGCRSPRAKGQERNW